MAMQWPPKNIEPKTIIHLHFADNLVNGTDVGEYRNHAIGPELKQFLRALPLRYSLPREFSGLTEEQQTLLDPATPGRVRRQIDERCANLQIRSAQRSWNIINIGPARDALYVLETSEGDDEKVRYTATNSKEGQLDLLLAAAAHEGRLPAGAAIPDRSTSAAAAAGGAEALHKPEVSSAAPEGTESVATESNAVQTERGSAGETAQVAPEYEADGNDSDGNDSDETNAFASDDEATLETTDFEIVCTAEEGYTLEVCKTNRGADALCAMVEANFTDASGNKEIPIWALRDSCKRWIQANEVHAVKCSSTRHPSCPCAACSGRAGGGKRKKTDAASGENVYPPLHACTKYSATDAPPRSPLSSCIVGDCYTSRSPLSPESCIGIHIENTKRKLHKDNLYHGIHSICGACYAQLPATKQCLYTKQPCGPLSQAAIRQIATTESLGYDDMLRRTIEGVSNHDGAVRGYVVRTHGHISAAAIVRHNLQQDGDNDALWFLELLCSRRGSGGGRKLLKSLLDYAFACKHWRTVILEVLNGRCTGKRLVSYYSEFFRYDDDSGNSWRASTGYSMQDALRATGGVSKLGEHDLQILRDKLESVCDHPVHGNPVMICTHPDRTLCTKQGRRYIDTSLTLEHQRISIAESIKDQEQAIRERIENKAALSMELVHEVYNLVFEMIKRMSIHDEFERTVASNGFKPTLKNETVKNAEGWIHQAVTNDSGHRFREGSICSRFVHEWISMATQRGCGLFDNGFGHGQLMAIAAIVCRCTDKNIPIAGCEMFAPRQKFAMRMWKRLGVDQQVTATRHSDEEHDRLFTEREFRSLPYIVFCNAENFTEGDKLRLSDAFSSRLAAGSTLLSLQPLFDRAMRRELQQKVVKGRYANTWNTNPQSVYEYSQ